MADLLSGEKLTTVNLPVDGGGGAPVKVLDGTDRRTSFEFNTLEATAGVVSYLVVDKGQTAPADADAMRQFPIGGIRFQDKGVPQGDVWIVAPAGVGKVKLVETF
jgi:hypothetical protein